jgi:TonB family protein
MLGQLVESSPRRVRRRFSTLVSVVAHAVVLSAAVAAARPVPEEPAVERVIPWYPPVPLLPADCTGCAARSRGGSEGRVDRMDFVVPDVITTGPTFDIPEDVGPVFQGLTIPTEEWKRGMTAGRAGDTTSVLGREVVDREVMPLATNPVPRYPAALRTAGIEGSVSARFVVDTTGRVLMESVIVNAPDHPLFADAVIEALRRARFTPAELRGRKVRQLVVQPFVFVIRD